MSHLNYFLVAVKCTLAVHGHTPAAAHLKAVSVNNKKYEQ